MVLPGSEWRRIITGSISKVTIAQKKDYDNVEALIESLDFGKISFKLKFFDEEKFEKLIKKLTVIKHLSIGSRLCLDSDNIELIELSIKKLYFKSIKVCLRENLDFLKNVLHQRNLRSIKILVDEYSSSDLFSLLNDLECPDLKHLFISGEFTNDEVISLIENKFINLQFFLWESSSNDSLTEKLFPVVHGLKSLQVVREFKDPLNIQLPDPSKLPNLKVLELGQFSCEVMKINPLEYWPQTKFLRLSQCHLDSYSSFLNHFSNFEVLDIDFFFLNPDLCKELLKNLGKIRFLRLGCPADSSSLFDLSLPKYYNLSQLSLILHEDAPSLLFPWISYCLPNLFNLQLSGYIRFWTSTLSEFDLQKLFFPKLKGLIFDINFPFSFWKKLFNEAPNLNSVYCYNYIQEELVFFKKKFPNIKVYQYFELSDLYFFKEQWELNDFL